MSVVIAEEYGEVAVVMVVVSVVMVVRNVVAVVVEVKVVVAEPCRERML